MMWFTLPVFMRMRCCLVTLLTIGLAVATQCKAQPAPSAAIDADKLLNQAAWIWSDKDVNAIPETYKKSLFTFTKEIQAEGEIKSANLRITAESQYSLAINGKNVGDDENWWRLTSYDIKPFLVAGKNTLTVQAKTKTWYAGLFVCGTIAYADGKTATILSDQTWDCASEVDGKVQKAEIVVRGVNGGWWNNCNRLMVMPASWSRLNTELVAPAIAWAKPFAGGKLKVLAILPRGKQRDIVDLMQRADVEVTAVFCDAPEPTDHRAPFFPDVKGALRSDIVNNLQTALQGPYDVVVLGPVDSDLFYEVVADKLAAMVQGGTGLVYSSLPGKKIPAIAPKTGKPKPTYDPAYEKQLTAAAVAAPPTFLNNGFPFEMLPGFKIGPKDHLKNYGKVVSLFEFGKGRVAKMGLSDGEGILANAADAGDLDYEYYQSFAIKTLLWAAQKEPAVQFQDFPVALTADAAKPGAVQMTFSLSGEKDQKYAVDLAIRSPEKLFRLPAVPVAQPGVQQGEAVLQPVYHANSDAVIGTPLTLALPALPAGSYFVDVTVANGTRKVNWATAALEVHAAPAISQVTCSPVWIDLTDGKSAQLTATVTLDAAAGDNATVQLELLDNDDRLLDQKEVKVAKGQLEAAATFTVTSFCTTLGKVRAELRQGQTVTAIGVGRFTTVRRDWDRFNFFAWTAGGTGHFSNMYHRVLAGLGLDAPRGAIPSLDTLEVADTTALPTYQGMPRQAFDLAEDQLQKVREKTQNMVESARPFDPVAYVCGDEIHYGGGDELPGRIADMRKALQSQYKTIEALNSQWGAKYAAFADIYPLTRLQPAKPTDEQKKLVPEKDFLATADLDRNYSRFVDQWMNDYKVFNDMNRIPRAIIKGADPAARVGMDCPMWEDARSGHDWYTFLQEFEMFAPYGREGEIQPYEDARSFARPGTLLGLEYGGYQYNAFVRREQLTDVEWQHWRVWSGLLRGFTSIWWYNLVPGAMEGNISPGLEPYPTLTQFADDLARIRSGYYTLFSRSKRDYGKIAIHYSIPSRLATSLIPDFGDESSFTIHFLMRIMQDFVGQQYTFVSDDQILKGGLKDYSVLLLPSSLAIGADEAKVLQQFVENGGVLIADVRPGILDEHGKWDEQQRVPALFGISFKKEMGRKMLTAAVSGQYEKVAFANQPGKFPADPSVALQGAQAAVTVDGVPLVTVKHSGRGAAVCLNIPFNYYRGYPVMDQLYLYLGDHDHNQMIGNILSAVLAARGIQRVVAVDVPQGNSWLAGLDIPYHRDGEAQYLALTKRRTELDEPVRQLVVHAPRPGYVYNMLTGECLGNTAQWNVSVQPADVQLFAILPYAVQSLTATCAQATAVRGGTLTGTVAVDIADAKPVRHVIGLTVTRPDGQVVRYLSRTMETQAGKAQYDIPLALNEPVGVYQLAFTDVASQKLASIAVSVK